MAGLRPALAEHGVALDVVFTHDLVGNVSGGLKRTVRFLGNADISLTGETEKMGLWKSGKIFLYGLGNYGGNPTKIVGDTQVTSNIEAIDTFKLYEAWYEHEILGGSLTVLAGLHDYNSEFYSLEYAGTLLNSSFGIGVDTAQVGPSIFSTTSLAVRVRYHPVENVYVLGAAYDGVPGDPNDPRGTQIRWDADEGFFWASEVGMLSGEDERYFKAAIGGWIHTATAEDPAGNIHDENYGAYLIGEYLLAPEADAADQGLGMFLQVGRPRSSRNQIDWFIGTGLTYTGFFDARPEDTTSFGVAWARNGDDFLNANPELDRSETAIEFTYRAVLTPWLTVQPDLQYIVNPGTDPAVQDAWVVGLRTEVAL
jgi:porin